MNSITLISSETCKAMPPPLPSSMVETTAGRAGRIAYLILSILLFPLGLVRLIGYILHQIAISNLVIPKSGPLNPEDRLDLVRKIKYLCEEKKAQSVSLLMPYGEKLKGIFIPGKRHPEKVALLVCPNHIYAADFAHRMNDNPSEISKLGISSLTIDYPGVADSEGSLSLENLPLSVYSSLNYLVKENGIRPEDIVVHGWSLGGGALAKGVALFEEENPRAAISIVHERSPADLLSVVEATMGSFCRFLAWSCNVQMDAKASFEKLRGKNLVVYHPKDEMIPHPASLAHFVQKNSLYKETKEEHSTLSLLELQGNHGNPHLALLSDKEADAIAAKVATMLKIPFTPSKGAQSPRLTHYMVAPLCQSL